MFLQIPQSNLADVVAQLTQKVSHLESELTRTTDTYGTALTTVISRVKKLEKNIKLMKARRRAHVVLSDDDQAEEDQGRNLLKDLNLEDPPHLDTERHSEDFQASEPVEEKFNALSAAKVLAKSAKKRRRVEDIRIYTRRS